MLHVDSTGRSVYLLDEWVLKLKAGFDAGYYKTEADPEKQTSFPWQNKTCQDCPFWLNGVCRVRTVARSGTEHTCSYFDQAHHSAAQQAIQERIAEGWSGWMRWKRPQGG